MRSLGVAKGYRKSDSVVCRNIAGEMLLVPIRGTVAEMDRLYALEGCARDVWELLSRARSEAELVDELLERYESDRDTVARDVSELLSALLERSLVETHEC